MLRKIPRIVFMVICVITTAGCIPISPSPLAKSIDPKVVIFANSQGRIDVTNTCSPATPPSPPMPDAWWNSLHPGQQPKVPRTGVVGFNLWRNQTDSCESFRQDLYRTAFSYDLSQLQGLKGLVTKAELSFHVAVMPAVRPNSFCQPMTGGGGSLNGMVQGTVLPQVSFIPSSSILPNGPISGPQSWPTTTEPFRKGATIFGMTFPWVPGEIINGVETLDGGGQRALFTVDITDRLNGALNQGDANMAFILSGSDENMPVVSPPDSFDCRTYYTIEPLNIKHY